MRKVLVIPCELIRPVDQLSKVTQYRLGKGLKLWESGDYEVIVVTGGIFLPPSTQTKSGGLLMAEWLIENGVALDKIIVENRSLDTFENVSNMLELFGGAGFIKASTHLTIVTHWLHAWRMARTVKAYAWNVRTHPLYYSVGVIGALAEAAFCLVHLFDPKGKRWFARYNRERRRAAAFS